MQNTIEEIKRSIQEKHEQIKQAKNEFDIKKRQIESSVYRPENEWGKLGNAMVQGELIRVERSLFNDIESRLNAEIAQLEKKLESIPEFKYERLVKKSNTFSSESELRELIAQFREMKGYKDSATWAASCEERLQEMQYDQLCLRMTSATSSKELREIGNSFKKIIQFKDSAKLSADCYERATRAEAEEVRVRAEQQRIADEQQRIEAEKARVARIEQERVHKANLRRRKVWQIAVLILGIISITILVRSFLLLDIAENDNSSVTGGDMTIEDVMARYLGNQRPDDIDILRVLVPISAVLFFPLFAIPRRLGGLRVTILVIGLILNVLILLAGVELVATRLFETGERTSAAQQLTTTGILYVISSFTLMLAYIFAFTIPEKPRLYY